LHKYVTTELGEASQHALETGQELLAAKKTVPHGRWETECKRLFDGSLRTAQFYMAFTRDFGKLKSAQKSALLMLEGTLDGAAKAAKKAAKPKPSPPKRQPDPDEPINVASEPVDAPETPEPDYGKCPNCAGTKWRENQDGVSCAKCHQPHGEPAGDVDEDRIKTQRQKTVKTGEALMRAFDDLQTMKAKPEHGGTEDFKADDVFALVRQIGAVKTCKGLLKIAKSWK
jgi:hypothetical protein